MATKLFLRPADRTPPPLTGQIADIELYSAATGLLVTSPFVAAGIANGTTIVNCVAVNAVAAVTWTVEVNNKVSFTGAALKRATAGGTLAPAVNESITIKALEALRPGGAFSKTFVMQVFDVPGTITLNGAQSATVQNTIAAGTVIGTLAVVAANGGTLAQPFTFTRTVNTDFSIGAAANGAPALVYSGGTLIEPESVTVRVTDNNGAFHDEVLTIHVQSGALATFDRFTPLAFPTNLIALVWTGNANDPTAEPLADGSNWCNEGGSTSFTAHSTGTHVIDGITYNSIPAIEGLQFATLHDVVDWMLLNQQGVNFTLRFGTSGNPYAYIGKFHWNQSNPVRPGGVKNWPSNVIATPARELNVTWAIMNNGFEDLGFDANGIRKWGRPNLRIRPMGGTLSSNVDGFMYMGFDPESLMNFRLDGVEQGPFDCEVVTLLPTADVDGSGTAPTYLVQRKRGTGLIFAEGFHICCISRCFGRQMFGNGISTIVGSSPFRVRGHLQVFDTKLTRCGSSTGLDHGIYVAGHNTMTVKNCASYYNAGHALKLDCLQHSDVQDTWLSTGPTGDAQDNWVTRSVGTFTSATSGYSNASYRYPMTRRTIPAVGPYTIRVEGYISNQFPGSTATRCHTLGTVAVTIGSNVVTGTGTSFTQTCTVANTITVNGETQTILAIASNTSLTTVGNWAQTTSAKTYDAQLPVKFVTGGATLAKVTSAPAASQYSITVTGTINENTESSHSAYADYTFNAADAAKQVDIGLHGFYLNTDIGYDGKCLNFDCPAQEAYIFNVKMEPTLDTVNTGVFETQERFNTAGMLYLGRPPYFKSQPFDGQVKKPEFVNAGIIGNVVQQPIMRIGLTNATYAIGSTQIVIKSLTSPLGGLFNGVAGPGLLSAQSPYDVEIRYTDGTRYTGVGTWVSGSVTTSTWPTNTTATLNISPALSKSTSSGLHVRVKPQSAVWDQVVIGASQEDSFNPAATHYYPFEISGIDPADGVRKLDFTKQRAASGRIYSYPVQYFDGNLVIPTAISSAGQPCMVFPRNSKYYVKGDGSGAPTVLPLPPMNSTDGSWTSIARGGSFDWDFHASKAWYINGSGGVGIDGSDGVRDDMMVLRNVCIFDTHLPSLNRFGALLNMPAQALPDTDTSTSGQKPDVRWLPQTGVAVGYDGLAQVPYGKATPAGWPTSVNFTVTTGCAPGANSFIANDVSLLSVGMWMQLETDTQYGIGTGTWGCTITAINTGTRQVTFSPALPSIAGVGDRHAQALSANVSITTRGGRVAAQLCARSHYYDRTSDPAGWAYPETFTYPL